ncbi:selenoprotein S [Stigmatopora argus]
MDDVEIEDVDENGNVQGAEDGQPPNNWLLFLAAGDALSPYACYLLAALAALVASLVYLVARSRRRGGAPPSSGEDAEAVARRREALESSRRRMQLEQDAMAAVFREKRQKAQEEKRRQKIQDWDSMRLGNTLRGRSALGPPQSDDEDAGAANAVVRAKTADKKPLRRSEYNPLSGEGGGSCSWRPGRRGPTSGG